MNDWRPTSDEGEKNQLSMSAQFSCFAMRVCPQLLSVASFLFFPHRSQVCSHSTKQHTHQPQIDHRVRTYRLRWECQLKVMGNGQYLEAPGLLQKIVHWKNSSITFKPDVVEICRHMPK